MNKLIRRFNQEYECEIYKSGKEFQLKRDENVLEGTNERNLLIMKK